MSEPELLDGEIARYLLGELPEDERDAFEARMLADDELHEGVHAVEDDLFDAYAEDALPGDRRLRFEATFLRDAAGQQRLAAARAILRAAQARPAPSWWARLWAAPRVWMTGLAVAAAAIALVVWSARGARAPAGADVVTIALVAPTRGASPPVVHLRGARHLRIEPDVLTATQAIVHGPDGNRVATTLQPGPPPIVLVGVAGLAPGTYVLSILPRGGEVVELPFTIAAD